MAGNSTEIIDKVGNVGFIQGIATGLSSATGLSQFWADMIVAVAIIILSYLLAKAVKYFLANIAPHFTSKTSTTLDDEILKAINGPLQVFILALGIYVACATLSEMPGLISNNLLILLTIALIFIAAYLVSNLAGALISWYQNDIAPRTESDIDDSLMPFLSKASTIIVYTVAMLMVLSLLHVDITPLVTTVGVGGIAVALAAQELLSNVFGAFAILSDRPYKIGDRVQLSDGLVGDITDIGLRSTRIKTLDNRLVVVPNTDISKSNIVNFSMPDERVRFDIKVGISYDADVSKATETLLDIASHTEGVLKDPPPKVYVKDLGDFSVNLLMHVWVSDYRLSWTVPDVIYREILKRFAKENIVIPYPTTSVILNRPYAGAVVEPVNAPVKR